MASIGIVGTGIAAAHLALYLQKHGVSATLYADRSPTALRAARLPNTVAIMGATQARDTDLGTHHWNQPEQGTPVVRITVAGDPPLAIAGKLDHPFLFVDMRVYVPRLIDDFVSRGGKLAVVSCSAEDVAKLSADHDFMVIATGRTGLTSMFPRIAEQSPYEQPQRRLFAGLFRGVRFPSPFTMAFNIVPGQGEIFENQFLMQAGYAACLLVEAIPGGPLEPLTHLRYEDGADSFNAAVLAVIREHAPETYARVDPEAFALTGPLDTLSGAVVPTVRRAVTPLPRGRFAMAVGDTHVTHDPLTGQGANAASRAAWLLGGLIVTRAGMGMPFDEEFCRMAEGRLWDSVRATTEWSNAFLQPPPPHAMALLAAASQHAAIGDAFVSNFNDPDRQWGVLSSPDATAAFIAGLGGAA